MIRRIIGMYDIYGNVKPLIRRRFNPYDLLDVWELNQGNREVFLPTEKMKKRIWKSPKKGLLKNGNNSATA